MPKAKKKKKEPVAVWTQRCPKDVVKGAMDVVKASPEARAQKLDKRTKLVNWLLKQVWLGKVVFHD